MLFLSIWLLQLADIVTLCYFYLSDFYRKLILSPYVISIYLTSTASWYCHLMLFLSIWLLQQADIVTLCYFYLPETYRKLILSPYVISIYLTSTARWYCHLMLFLFTRALQEADVVVLFGARLNWMLHFGAPPRFNPKVKIIQVKSLTSTKKIKTNLAQPFPSVIDVCKMMVEI